MVYVNLHIMREKLARYAGLMRGKLLDLGAGTTPYRAFFKVDQYVAANARKYYLPVIPAEVAQHTDIWIEDSLPLPFDSATFDGIVCFQVLSVIREPETLFKEFARIIKPGGHVLLATDFLYPKWAKGDVYRYTDVCLRALAESQGFEVLAIEGFGSWPTTVHCILMRYIRDYPARIFAARTRTRKACRGMLYSIWVVGMPIWAVVGWFIFLLDRNIVDDYTFTVNLLLVAKRRVDFAQSVI
jgi:SAM-dependent methyltransferase